MHQGRGLQDDEGFELLNKSAIALQAALEIYTKKDLPKGWAHTQNMLGAVLQSQGSRIDGEAGTALLAKSVTAYRAALEVYTPTVFPQDWGSVQNNMGMALQQQGERMNSVALLAQAAQAYKNGLTVFTKKISRNNGLCYKITLGMP